MEAQENQESDQFIVTPYVWTYDDMSTYSTAPLTRMHRRCTAKELKKTKDAVVVELMRAATSLWEEILHKKTDFGIGSDIAQPVMRGRHKAQLADTTVSEVKVVVMTICSGTVPTRWTQMSVEAPTWTQLFDNWMHISPKLSDAAILDICRVARIRPVRSSRTQEHIGHEHNPAA